MKVEKKGCCAKIMGTTLILFCLIGTRLVLSEMYPEMDRCVFGCLNLLFNFGGLFCTPMVVLYFMLLTVGRVKRWQWWMLFAPSGILWLAICVLYFTCSWNDLSIYIAARYFHVGNFPETAPFVLLNLFDWNLYAYLIRFEALVGFFYCWIHVSEYRDKLKAHFSNKKGGLEGGNRFAFFAIFILYIVYIISGKLLPEMGMNGTLYQNVVFLFCFFSGLFHRL